MPILVHGDHKGASPPYLNADIRYCDVLKKKKQIEAQEITYNVIKTTKVVKAIKKKEEMELECGELEVDGELMENEIRY